MEICNDITRKIRVQKTKVQKTKVKKQVQKISAENNLKSGCRKQVQKITRKNKYRKQIQKTNTENNLKFIDYENNCKKCNNK